MGLPTQRLTTLGETIGLKRAYKRLGIAGKSEGMPRIKGGVEAQVVERWKIEEKRGIIELGNMLSAKALF